MKQLTQEEHYDNAEAVRCSNCNFMSFPDSGTLAELLTDPEWEDKDNDIDRGSSYATWAGCWMRIEKHTIAISPPSYRCSVSFHLSDEGAFFSTEVVIDGDNLPEAKEVCINAVKNKYRMMLLVDAEKQQAKRWHDQQTYVPDHLGPQGPKPMEEE